MQHAPRLPARTGLLPVLAIAAASLAVGNAASATIVNVSLQSYGGWNLTTTAFPGAPDFRVSLSGGTGGTRDAYTNGTYGITNTSNQPYNAYSLGSSRINFAFTSPVKMVRFVTVSFFSTRGANYTVTRLDGTKTTTLLPAAVNGAVDFIINAGVGSPIVRVELWDGYETTNYVCNVSAMQYELANPPATPTAAAVVATATPAPPTAVPVVPTAKLVPPTATPASGWTQLGSGMAFTSASVGSATRFSGIVGGQSYSGNGSTWAADGIAMVQGAYGNDGDRWGVSATNVIYHRGASWTVVSGLLKQISVGNASNVWGVNSAGNVFQWGPGWQQKPGTFATVSVGADGTVWGLQANDSIWRWNGAGWTQVPGALRWISVGSASNVWGVNVGGAVFKYTGSGWAMPSVPAGTYVGVSTAYDGTTVLVRNDGTLWKK